MDALRLPVQDNPGFNVECYHNFRLGVVLADPASAAWIHGQFIHLILRSEHVEAFPVIRFEDHLDVYGDVLDERPLRPEGDPVALIRDTLRRGNYVILYLNWKWVPGSSFYQKRDLVHEALVFGFDDRRECFDMLAFQPEGKPFGIMQLGYGDCRRELARVLAEEMKAQRWFAFYGFPLAEVTVRHTYPRVMDARRLYFTLDRAHIQAHPGRLPVFASGYGVYEALAIYIQDRAEDGKLDPRDYDLWNITVRKMLLHQKLAYGRLRWLQAHTGTRNAAALALIQQLNADTKRALAQIQAMSFRYQRTREPEPLREVARQLRQAYEWEKRASAMLMEYLNARQLYNNAW